MKIKTATWQEISWFHENVNYHKVSNCPSSLPVNAQREEMKSMCYRDVITPKCFTVTKILNHPATIIRWLDKMLKPKGNIHSGMPSNVNIWL